MKLTLLISFALVIRIIYVALSQPLNTLIPSLALPTLNAPTHACAVLQARAVAGVDATERVAKFTLSEPAVALVS